MGPVIAIVGTDGSGKSTVGEILIAWLKEKGPAELCHLGKQSANLARNIGRLPLLGRRMEHKLNERVKKAEASRGPSFIESLGVFVFAVRRYRRFKRMLKLRDKGITILTDRFPQIAVPSGLDGPGFARFRTETGLAKKLAAIEWRQFEWMTSHRPDLVVRLNVDLPTALARKPDHDPERLAEKIAGIPKLSFRGAPIADIDATRPLDEVIAEAKAAISKVLR